MPHDHENITGPMAGIHSMRLNWREWSAVITLRNGYQDFMRLPGSPSTMMRPIRRSEYFPSSNEVHFETDRGELLVAEVPAYGQPPPLAGRPVVYLDQKDWSLMANVLYEPIKVESSIQRDAATRLIELARNKRVILPMSFGHLTETAQWTDTDRRYRLALTLLELTRGWQMRHPVDVRHYELMQSMSSRFKREPLPAVHIVTLEPCAAQADSLFRSSSTAMAGLPLEIAVALDACNCISSYFSAVLDAEDVQMEPILEWESGFQRLTDWLANVSISQEQKRKITQTSFSRDIRFEIDLATRFVGISDEELSAWADKFAYSDIPIMPSLGLFREVYVNKHLDRTARWHKNDLIDMMHLCCAAGYADYVVGERSLVSRIKQAATRLHRPLNIYRNLSELMVDLEGDRA